MAFCILCNFCGNILSGKYPAFERWNYCISVASVGIFWGVLWEKCKVIIVASVSDRFIVGLQCLFDCTDINSNNSYNNDNKIWKEKKQTNKECFVVEASTNHAWFYPQSLSVFPPAAVAKRNHTGEKDISFPAFSYLHSLRACRISK